MYYVFMKKIIAIIVFASYLFAAGMGNTHSHIEAQTTPTANMSPADVRTIQAQEITGEVMALDNDSLTVDTNQGPLEISIPGTVAVKRNAMQAALSDIQTGDDVTITLSEDGQALAIEATAGEVRDWSNRLIPLLTGALLVLGLMWWFMRKANKSHIKTTAT
jgi:hypothetical protein